MIIATALGLYFTPAIAREVGGRWELLVAAAVFATVLSYAGAWFISRFSDSDRTTAFFASVPGETGESGVSPRHIARPISDYYRIGGRFQCRALHVQQRLRPFPLADIPRV